mgnify:CR=1 FL=1
MGSAIAVAEAGSYLSDNALARVLQSFPQRVKLLKPVRSMGSL